MEHGEKCHLMKVCQKLPTSPRTRDWGDPYWSQGLYYILLGNKAKKLNIRGFL